MYFLKQELVMWKKLIATLWLGISAVQAAELPVPQAEYTAIREITSSEGVLVQQVYHSFGKERVEMEFEGMSSVMISRPDLGKVWSLMPMFETYSEINTQQASQMRGDLPSDVTIDKVGPETLDGMATTKYKIVMKDKSAGGFLWLSEQNIPVQMDFLSKEGKSKSRMRMKLTDLKLAPQDKELFELPKGLKPMPGMSQMMGMMGQ